MARSCCSSASSIEKSIHVLPHLPTGHGLRFRSWRPRSREIRARESLLGYEHFGDVFWGGARVMPPLNIAHRDLETVRHFSQPVPVLPPDSRAGANSGEDIEPILAVRRSK
jgi:hypothetical protein